MNCTSCNVELIPVFEHHDIDVKQYDNALWITFDGGYGEFIDICTMEDAEHHRAILCHECAHQLCDLVPWIHKLIDPHRSHSHKTSYIEQHPEHYGWDYDYRASRQAKNPPV